MLIGDVVMCEGCRTCPHGWTYFYTPNCDSLCFACLREAFTYQSFFGRRIDDMKAYFDAAKAYGVLGPSLQVWRVQEEEQIWKAMEDQQMVDNLERVKKIKAAVLQNPETNSANEITTLASTSERSGTSPCPLPHHLARGRASSGPSGSSSR